VTNRYGHRMTLVLGFVVVTVGFVLMLALDQQTGLLGLVAPFAAIGLGTGMVMTASIQVVLASVEDADAGTASGLQQTATQVGGIAGTAVLGSVMAAYVSRTFARELERAGAGSYSVEDQAAKLVGQGLSPLSGKNGSLAAAVQAATEATFVSGLHLVMVVGAVVTFAGMMLGLFIRPVVVQADHDHGIISHG
jgi:MFS family permease